MISIASNELFQNDTIKGTLNKNEECEIRNISDEDHKYTYWNELGQKLLNNAVEVNNKLFSVDHENAKRIFEFRHSYANKFHGFLQEDLPPDLVNRILREDEKKD